MININTSQSQVEDIIKNVINELKLQDSIPFETIFGELLNQNILFEGLITSYPYQSVINILKKKLIAKYNISPNVYYRTQDNDRQYQIVFICKNGLKNIPNDILKEYIHIMDTCGWYPSIIIDENGEHHKEIESIINSINSVSIFFEPKYDLEIPSDKIPDYCYHITPIRVAQKILNKNGLTPKDYGKVGNHPERLYLFLDDNKNWKNIADNFKSMNLIDEKYCYLKISMKNLKNKIKFYYDQNSNQYPAIYTLEPIPNFAITIIDKE